MVCFGVGVGMLWRDFNFLEVLLEVRRIVFEFVIMRLLCSFGMWGGMKKDWLINVGELWIVLRRLVEIVWWVVSINRKFDRCR